jgi:hypothetical protein
MSSIFYHRKAGLLTCIVAQTPLIANAHPGNEMSCEKWIYKKQFMKEEATEDSFGKGTRHKIPERPRTKLDAKMIQTEPEMWK